MQKVGANYEAVKSGKAALNVEQINQLFNQEVQVTIGIVKQNFKNYGSLCCNVEQALVDMTYDLANGIGQFHQLISAVQNEEWDAAASAVQNS